MSTMYDVDWTASYAQTYEFYEVDPVSWTNKRRLTQIKGFNIQRDLSSDTLGSATVETTEDFGEIYIRAYMIVEQNGHKTHVPLGTYVAQTSDEDFDGKVKTISMDAYTPLIELKERKPPYGYTVLKDSSIMDTVYQLTRSNLRAPITKALNNSKKLEINYVADTDEDWLSYILALLGKAEYSFDLNEMGEIAFSPSVDIAAMQPSWTYTDDNSSILLPTAQRQRDLYNVPNVVEVVYSQSEGSIISRIENDDPNSQISILNRGREILHREASPTLIGVPDQTLVDEYAKKLLRDLSTLKNTVTYTHGFCPVKIGDCVRLNYERAGLKDVKARVISQSFSCTTGCTVSETAVFTEKLWGD